MKISNALKRAAIVALGVGLGPLVQLLATPLLSRIYAPAEFGHLALFLSVVSIMVTISCLRYEGAIQVVKDMHSLNIKSVMLSVDKQSVVDKVAKQVGIDFIQIDIC